MEMNTFKGKYSNQLADNYKPILFRKGIFVMYDFIIILISSVLFVSNNVTILLNSRILSVLISLVLIREGMLFV